MLKGNQNNRQQENKMRKRGNTHAHVEILDTIKKNMGKEEKSTEYKICSMVVINF